MLLCDIYTAVDVLIETYETGQPCRDVLGYNKTDVDTTNTQTMLSTSEDDKPKLAQLGLHTMLKMIFIDNFVHGDLHPGNILLRVKNACTAAGGDNNYNIPSKKENVLLHGNSNSREEDVGDELEMVILDAGIVCELEDQDQRNFADLFKGISKCHM